MTQSIADVKTYIQRRLGFGVVAVELTDDMIDDSIQDAKEWFSGYSNQILYYTETIPASRTFSVPDDCQEVVDVIFESDSSFGDYFLWADVEINPLDFGWGFGGSNGESQEGFLSTYTQLVQYLDMSKRVFGSDSTWEWFQMERLVKLFPSSAGSVGTRALIAYLTNDMQLPLMYPYQYRILKQYAYAEAMDRLGQIRTKYASIPSSTGEATLNGDTLFANADALKDRLEEKLKKMRQPIGFLVG